MEDYYSHRNSAARYSTDKVDDSGDEQYVDISGYTNEKFTKVMRIQPHGFGSNPMQDSHHIGVSPGGALDRIYLLGGEHKDYRQKNVPQGGSVLYDSKGNVVSAFNGDGIKVSTAAGPVAISSKDKTITVTPGKGQNVYLGGDGKDGTYAPVMTTAGPSSNVFAKV